MRAVGEYDRAVRGPMLVLGGTEVQTLQSSVYWSGRARGE